MFQEPFYLFSPLQLKTYLTEEKSKIGGKDVLLFVFAVRFADPGGNNRRVHLQNGNWQILSPRGERCPTVE